MPKINKVPETAEATEAAFYDAIARADIETLMSLWADDEEIICIHPGAPRLTGHAAIRASWESILARDGIRIQPIQLHVIQNLMTSVHSVVEEIRRDGNDGKDMHIVATNLYVKTPRGWRISVHHASVASGAAPSDHSANTLH